MPSRIVREGILTSLKVDRLSSGAENFYRRILNVVDDFGRYHGTPALLRSAAFPLKVDKVLDAHITGWVAECVSAGLVETYLFDELPYIEVLNFGNPRAKQSKFKRLQADESKCKQMRADANNRTVVVVESVVETTPSASDDAGGNGQPRNDYPDDFESWWLHYPRKKDKRAAYREWRKLSAEQRYQAADYVTAFAEAWETYDPGKNRIQFCVYPERWLKDHCWEDDANEWILMARGK